MRDGQGMETNVERMLVEGWSNVGRMSGECCTNVKRMNVDEFMTRWSRYGHGGVTKLKEVL